MSSRKGYVRDQFAAIMRKQGGLATRNTPIAPHNTSIAPPNTSIAPHNTSIAPPNTSIAPHNTPVAPYNTPVAPYNTLVAPHYVQPPSGPVPGGPSHPAFDKLEEMTMKELQDVSVQLWIGP